MNYIEGEPTLPCTQCGGRCRREPIMCNRCWNLGVLRVETIRPIDAYEPEREEELV